MSILQVLAIVLKIRLYKGKERPHKVTTVSLLSEDWFRLGDDNSTEKRIRTPQCDRVVSFSATSVCCHHCQNMDVYSPPTKHSSEDNIIMLDECDSKDFEDIMRTLIPNASDEFIQLVQLQRKILATPDPRGYRWSRDMIRLCLTLYTRSPQAYKDLQASNILKMPSGKQLSLYKNSVPQNAGIQMAAFTWLYKEANRLQISPEGRTGGLIFDEMKIQEDLQLIRCGDQSKLVGFVDLGNEANDVRSLKSGTEDKELADHVLQLQFVGMTGLRFPLCHFPTRCAASATYLHIAFWNGVDVLESYGFRIMYTNMDGAESNRQFLKINFQNRNAVDHMFKLVVQLIPIVV
jgi:hypothetical protein